MTTTDFDGREKSIFGSYGSSIYALQWFILGFGLFLIRAIFWKQKKSKKLSKPWFRYSKANIPLSVVSGEDTIKIAALIILALYHMVVVIGLLFQC